MEQRLHEYRYGRKARRQAALWLTLSSLLAAGLLAALIGQWAEFELLGKGLGTILLISLLYTMRAQLGRLTYRCRILPDRLHVSAPLNNRAISWAKIVEVRRMDLPRFGGRQAWACTIFTHSRHGHPSPTYLFDDQLEQAEHALQEIVQYTPHAQHINV